MPLGLMGLPTSMATTAFTTRAGPVPAIASRASISTRQAVNDRVSWCAEIPWAKPAGMGLPQLPAAATFLSTARARSSRR